MQSYSKKLIWSPSIAQFPPTKIAAEHLKQTRSNRSWKLKDGSKRLHKAFCHHLSVFLWWTTDMIQAHQALPVTLNSLQGRELSQLYFVWCSTSHPPRVFQVKMPPQCSSTLSLKPTWHHLAASHPALIDDTI